MCRKNNGQTKLHYPALSIELLTESGKLKYQDSNMSKCNAFLMYIVLLPLFTLCRDVVSIQLLKNYYYTFHSAFVCMYFTAFFITFSCLMCICMFSSSGLQSK